MSTLLYLLFLSALPAAFGTAADTVYTIPEVTVTATRLERSTFESTAHIDVIDGDAARMAGARHLGDMLQRSTGTFIRRYGAGGLASISLRGTGSSQTAILLDGRRLSDPQLGQLDLTLLPAAMLSSVEVMNGTASPLYGADAIGGAVQLLTMPPTSGSTVRFRAGTGAFGMREGSMTAGSTYGPFSLILSADTESAENDYSYFSRALQRDVRLDNADRSRSSFYGSARMEQRATDVRLSLLRTTAERGLAGISAASRHERQWDESTRVWGDVRFGRLGSQVRIGGLLQHASLRYVNEVSGLDQEGSNRVMSVDAELTQNLPGTWMLIAGAEAATARAFHPQIDNVNEHRGAVFLQSTGELGAVLVNAAVRGDVYRDPDEATGEIMYGSVNPRIGVSLPLGNDVRLRASIARGFRPPTFNDRYWMPGGNPNLSPERGWTRDAGLVLQTRRTSAQLTAFHVTTRDQIVWLPVTGTIWSPENLSSTRSVGVETSLSLSRPLGRVTVQSDVRYSFTHSRDLSDDGGGRYLRYVPRDLLRAGLSTSYEWLDAGIALDYTGRRYINADGSDWLDAFLTASLRLNAAHELAGVRLRTGIILENLFDTDYTVVAGHPMPPRHMRFSLSIETSIN